MAHARIFDLIRDREIPLALPHPQDRAEDEITAATQRLLRLDAAGQHLVDRHLCMLMASSQPRNAA